ncbi:NIL domain-containing protein [Chloroflexota bacterium]
MIVSKKIVLHFPSHLLDQPIVYRLIKEFDLSFNILKASVIPNEEGYVVVELSGEQDNYDRGVKYLAKTGVIIDALSQNVLRNDNQCTHCGVCVTICPTGAFELDKKTRRVAFIDGKCIACGLCIKACPPRAMELHF